jgi:uncharacterized membrane protein YdjX (TVP38/TMEM64 family)
MLDPTPPHPATSVRRLVPLGLLVAAGIAFVAIGGHRYLTLSALAANRERLCDLVARWGAGAAVFYVLLYAAAIALSLPGGAILTLAGGFMFGTWIGGACAVIGATIGSAAIFLAARAGLTGLPQCARPWLAKFEAAFGAHAFNYLVVLRLVPLFPFWLVNLVPALAGVGLSTFVLATLFGIMPGTFVYASIGNGLGKAVEQPDAEILLRPSVLGPALALALLALVPVWCRRWWRKSRL